MVVFVDGPPKRNESRRFRIKGVAGQNDFAMMQEVLKRRFWKVRRETEGEGANEGTPDRQADHDTDREAVQAALCGPNAGALMTAANGNGRNENRKSKNEREAGSSPVGHEYDESFQTMPGLVIVEG